MQTTVKTAVLGYASFDKNRNPSRKKERKDLNGMLWTLELLRKKKTCVVCDPNKLKSPAIILISDQPENIYRFLH